MPKSTMITLALLFFLLASPVGAERPAPEPAEQFGTWQSWVSTGRYGDAEDALKKARTADPKDARVALLLGRLQYETGRAADALGVLNSVKDDIPCGALASRCLLRLGRRKDALQKVEKLLKTEPESLPARAAHIQALLATGDRKGAAAACEWFFDFYATNDVTDAEGLTAVGEASVTLARLQPDVQMDFQVTQKLLQSIIRKFPEHNRAYLVMGDLYMAVYQDQDALKQYRNLLKVNPRSAPALFGQARQLAFRFNEFEAVKKCREVLLVDPHHFEAKEFIARVEIGDAHYGAARKLLDEILAINPDRLSARGLLASIDLLTGRREEFRKKVKAIHVLDPKFGEMYRDLASIMESQRRFVEAAKWARQAVKTDPEDFRSWETLGRNLVHQGKEEEAKKALEKSLELDPFAHYLGKPQRENMIEVLGRIEEFVETRTPNFIYKIHVGENAVLSRYYHRFMELSFKGLTEKYGYKPEVPILTEVFHLHPDFAARTIGLPGIGALGACFGKVITLDSPSARRPGAFTWASTAHHEFAHVMTLQMSKYRIPRWFTEGLSVYEERKFSVTWVRDMDQTLFDAYHGDEIFPIATFNREFRGPNVLFAYYLGGMMCEWIEEAFGFEKLLRMVRAFGEEKQTKSVISEVLGLTEKEYDAQFREWVGAYVKDMRIVPRVSRKTVARMTQVAKDDPKNIDAHLTLAWAALQRGSAIDAKNHLARADALDKTAAGVLHLRGALAMRAGKTAPAEKWFRKFLEAGADDMHVRLHLGRICRQRSDMEEAILHYEAAKKCFPNYVGGDSARLALHAIFKADGKDESAMRELAGHVRLANTDLPHRLELADWYEEQGEWKQLADILTQVVYIHPIDPSGAMTVHVRLARARRRLSDYEGAALEFEVALELGVPEDEEADVRVELGEVLLLLGRSRDASMQAEAVLEGTPDHEGARALKEKIRAR